MKMIKAFRNNLYIVKNDLKNTITKSSIDGSCAHCICNHNTYPFCEGCHLKAGEYFYMYIGKIPLGGI